MITSVTAGVAQDGRAAERERTLTLKQLFEYANRVGLLVVSLDTPGDATDKILWQDSEVMPQQSSVEVTVNGRSVYADFSAAGRFHLERIFSRGTGAATPGSQTNVNQPLGIETMVLELSADGKIQIRVNDDGIATTFKAYVEYRP